MVFPRVFLEIDQPPRDLDKSILELSDCATQSIDSVPWDDKFLENFCRELTLRNTEVSGGSSQLHMEVSMVMGSPNRWFL